MKTNHQRGFKASTHPDKGGQGWGTDSVLADRSFYGYIGHDFTNGNRGMAKAVRGAKKYVRTRLRFHENAVTQKLVKEQI